LVSRLPAFALKPGFGVLLARGHDDAAKRKEALGAHSRPYAEYGGGAALARQVTALDMRDTLAVQDRPPGAGRAGPGGVGVADRFQKVEYGERFARDLGTTLERVEGGKHFTPEDHPDVVPGAGPQPDRRGRGAMSRAPEVAVFDANETLSDLEPLRARLVDRGVPASLLDTWFAATLRDGFALAAAGRSKPFPVVGAGALRGLLTGRPLTGRVDDVVVTLTRLAVAVGGAVRARGRRPPVGPDGRVLGRHDDGVGRPAGRPVAGRLPGSGRPGTGPAGRRRGAAAPPAGHHRRMSLFARRRPAPPESEVSPDEPAGSGAEVVVIDDASFLDLTQGGWTVVDFWASWCAPCRSFAPVFRSVAAAHQGPVRFGACEVDANPRTAALLGIRSIPTLVVFGPDGSEVGRSQGLVSRGDLEAPVRQLSAR
jgi:thiol-disulfide isomerase/thioredoxin